MSALFSTSKDTFAPGLFDGVTVAITGGGSGIGRATAVRFAALGAKVSLCGRRREMLDVSKALVDLRPEGAPALRTENCQRTRITKRAVYDLLRDAQGRLARMPPDSTGEPRSGAELLRDSPALLSALVDSLGVQVLIARLHSPIARPG
jgi:NAD(P)-dependent dehydrogenase (short-subunit alcohol dehydrogenase family)